MSKDNYSSKSEIIHSRIMYNAYRMGSGTVLRHQIVQLKSGARLRFIAKGYFFLTGKLSPVFQYSVDILLIKNNWYRIYASGLYDNELVFILKLLRSTKTRSWSKYYHKSINEVWYQNI